MTDYKHGGTLDRIIWRSRVKALLRIGGILLMVIGLMFMPAWGRELGPKSTIFSWIGLTGMFAKQGMLMIAIGAVAFAASWLIRGDGPFDWG
jgi:hypothetical protein